MSEVPVYIGGHSLGGACSYGYAYSRLKRGLRVDGIFALAPARPGDGKIGLIFRTALPSRIRGIGNHGDPVPNVPFDMALANEIYEQPYWPLEEIDEAPAPGADIIFGRHQVALYQRGCKKLPQGIGPISLDRAAFEIARLYDSSTGWNWINPVDGLWWSMIEVNGARLMIKRGSCTLRDWFRDDFDAVEVDYYGARMSRGFVSAIAPISESLDAVLDRP